MKLQITKFITMLLPLIGVMLVFAFAISGHIIYGWGGFVILTLLSGVISFLFFRCPHCHKAVPANGTSNQKYCPYCKHDLGMKPSRISYYGKCSRTKKGTLKAKTIIGPTVFLVCTFILLLIIVVLFGSEGLTKGIGKYLALGAVLIGIILGFFCRVVVGSSAKLDQEYLYYSKFPGFWKKYKLDELKEHSKEKVPFYHVTKGYVLPTEPKTLALPVSSYMGGQEFLRELTERLNQPMIDIRPDLILSKHSLEAKRDDGILGKFENNKKDEE